MAPSTRGTKRAAPAAEEVALKKVQESLKASGVSKANYKAVVEGVEHPLAQESLAEDCRKMIVSMIAQGLCVPVDERHEHQTLAVNMIGEVLDTVRSKMLAKIDAEDAKVQEARDGMSALEEQARQAEATYNEAVAGSEACKQELAAASKTLLGAKTALAEREEEQRKGDASLVEAKADKETIETVLAGDFQKLKDGDYEAGQAKQHWDSIQAITGKIALDESLITAMPGTMMKKPSDRGPFDEMVVEQLANCLRAKVQELSTLLEEGAPASAARATAVEAAQAALEAAKTAQQDGASALKVAQDKQREMSELMEAARQKVKDCEPNREKAVEVCEALKQEMQTFQDLNITTFEMLKERISAKRRKLLAAEAAEEAKAKEAAEAAAAAALAEQQAAEQAAEKAAEQADATMAAAKEDMAATAAVEVAEAGA